MALTQDDFTQLKDMMIGVVNDALNEIVLPRFDRLEGRMDRLETRMDRLEERMGRLEERMTSVERDVASLRDEMRAGFDGVNKRIDELSGHVDGLEADVRALYLLLSGHEKGRLHKNDSKQKLEITLQTMQNHIKLIAKETGITLS